MENKNKKVRKEKVVSCIEIDNECLLDFSKYKVKDKNNRYLTTEMFDDHPANKRINNKKAPFSLFNDEHIYDDDGDIIYSFKKIFLSLEDSSGYQAALTCFGSYEHYNKILTNQIVAEKVDEWINELRLRELSLIKKACIKEVKTLGKSSMQAAKILISLNNQDPNSPMNRKDITSKNIEEDNKKNVKTNSLSEEQVRILENYNNIIN